MKKRCSITIGFLVFIAGFFSAVTVSALTYSFTTIDFPGASSTGVGGINNHGHVVGSYQDAAGAYNGFVFNGNGFQAINYPGASYTTAEGINDQGLIAGGFESQGPMGGYLFDGQNFTPVSSPLGTHPDAFFVGLNNNGAAVGTLIGQSWLAFEYNAGAYKYAMYPNADTYGTDINDAGVMVGGMFSGQGNHGFLYDNGVFEFIEIAGSAQTIASGINNANQVVGYYFMPANEPHSYYGEGFLYENGIWQAFAMPNGHPVYPTDINDKGQIVGFYNDELGQHGFLASPVPLPGSFLLGVSGLTVIAALRKRLSS